MKKTAASNRTKKQPSELLQSALAPRPTIAERLATGKALRSRVPRAAHAEYKPSPKRKDPIAIIEEQAKTRLPQLVPIRHARMLDEAMAAFANAYADQTERDHTTLVKAAKSGRLSVAKEF